MCAVVYTPECRSIDFQLPMVGAEGLDGALQAVPLYTQAPVWMTRIQPLGTPGTNGSWNGDPLWPGLHQIGAANQLHLQAGESLNYTALRAWFLPRFAEWLSNGASAAITLEEVVSVLSSDAVWVKPSRAAQQCPAVLPQQQGQPASVEAGLACGGMASVSPVSDGRA